MPCKPAKFDRRVTDGSPGESVAVAAARQSFVALKEKLRAQNEKEPPPKYSK